ncbi:MAG TPA: serine hydrolase domain-containing protein [Gaiellaceae bacterium]
MLNTRFFELCEAVVERWRVPALAVGVLEDGAIETFAVGCDVETRFRVASITKTLTAQLGVGLLELDEPTGVWPDDVRVRHLLSHTSGFDSELPQRDGTRFGTGDDALAQNVAELPLVHRFFGVDEMWSYANTGYCLAGHLAALRTGMSFEDALAANVLAPARLDATSFDEPDLAGHGPDVPPTPYPRARRPAGGLTSTVGDVLRYAQWHLEQPNSARMRVVAGKPIGGVYGFGLSGERVGAIDVWGHRGNYGGFQSSLLTIPDRGAAFAGLTNCETGSKALRELEDAFFELTLGARRRVPEYVSLPVDVYESYTGTYAFANGDATFQVSFRGDDELVVRLGEDEIRARPISERAFVVPDGVHINERFDFPHPGFVRFSRLAERVA